MARIAEPEDDRLAVPIRVICIIRGLIGCLPRLKPIMMLQRRKEGADFPIPIFVSYIFLSLEGGGHAMPIVRPLRTPLSPSLHAPGKRVYI